MAGFADIASKANARNDAAIAEAHRCVQRTDDAPKGTECVSDAHAIHTPYTRNAHNAQSDGALKRRVNVTLAADVHETMRSVAERYGTSVSGLVLEGWLAIKGRYGE